MRNDRKKVSVLLTSFNHEKYISEAIDSVLYQSFEDFELCIIDDASTDKSWEIIQSYDDPRIKAIRAEQNTIGGLFYDTIRSCGSQYIAVHHSDDAWEPGKLQKQVEYMDTHPDVTACFTLVRLIDDNSEDLDPPQGHPFYKGFEQPNRNRYEWLRHFFEKHNALCHPSVLIRTGAYASLDLIPAGLCRIPDFVSWIRVCLAGEIYVIQEKLTKFRHHTAYDNQSGDGIEARIRGHNEYFLLQDEYFKISREDLFYNVFPEFESQDVVPEFVVAEKMLRTPPLARQLYGLHKIYKMLNNPSAAAQIRDLHNYTYVEFIGDTAKLDTFSMQSLSTFLSASLLYDIGNGFNWEDKLTETALLMSTGVFVVKFTFPKKKDGVLRLRFDPDESRFWEMQIVSVTIDGAAQEATAQNSTGKVDGYDVFMTTDPIYLLTSPSQIKEVAIVGKARAINAMDAICRAEKERDDFAARCDGLSQQIEGIYRSKTWRVGRRISQAYRLFSPRKRTK